MKRYRGGAFLKNPRELELMAEANRMVANMLDAIGDAIEVGLTTMHVEHLVQAMCIKYGVKPAFQGYRGYPYATCCSVNEAVVHGFPTERKLRSGDIVSVDIGVEYGGFVGDAARTYPVGDVDSETMRLMRVTEESLYLGIEKARSGNDLYDVSWAVQSHVEAAGFHVVKQYCGHGVGSRMHEKPDVPNFRPSSGSFPLAAGMVIAIEPMVGARTGNVRVLGDKWTAVTTDGSYAAHFEHSVAITSSGPRILSVSDRGLNRHTIPA
ncbi:MAG: type I methionyl aminopeptidase [Desulfovibrio sp.]|jgi:methionyl aminopeptidase|nr:type I methionyl aminopeptidase [Desulfovibrio sp.]